MPRSLYPLFRAGNLHPVRFSRERMAPTFEQVEDYVYCGDCEKTCNRECARLGLYAIFTAPAAG